MSKRIPAIELRRGGIKRTIDYIDDPKALDTIAVIAALLEAADGDQLTIEVLRAVVTGLAVSLSHVQSKRKR